MLNTSFELASNFSWKKELITKEALAKIRCFLAKANFKCFQFSTPAKAVGNSILCNQILLNSHKILITGVI